jgi:hypothetical protein
MSIMALRRRLRVPGFRWLPNRYPLAAPAFAAWQFPERRAG